MINNFDTIKELLIFDSDDDFYHLQILKRKKENPELGSNSRVIKTYYIRSVEHLKLRMPEIISMCEFNNARAYINLSPRSFERIAFHTLKKVCDIIMNKDYKSIRNAYESVAGEFGNGKHKRWVVDFDYHDPLRGYTTAEANRLDEMTQSLENFQRDAGVEPLCELIPTKNGVHIITKPFDVRKFKIIYPDIDLHKNNPTILYM